MGERRIALVGVDSLWREPRGTFKSFSYGIEKLRASLRSAPDLADVEILLIDLRTDDPDAFFAELEKFRPTMVALSTYIWSLGVFAGVVERLRKLDPKIVIVAGGPAARRIVFDLPAHQPLRDRLDAIVPGEGEGTIRDLARAHLDDDWKTTVPGLDVPSRGLWRSTAAAERPDIEAYPSPYQLGTAPRNKTGYVETFRGCPIHCAFCQWGEQRSDRVHGVDYLASHLEGLARSDVADVFFLDAAFNLSPRAFRSLVAAEDRTRALADKVVHGHLYPTYLKEEHLAFFDGLRRVQASVGIQSFDEDVLRRLGRPFDVERFEGVLKMMRGRLTVDLELIFGLPGDDPASFRRTLERSLELGSSVKIFKCLVLPDALIERSREFGIDFDPRTFALRSCEGWTADDLAREWEAVYRMAEASPNAILNDDWVGFVIREPEPARVEQVPSIAPAPPLEEASVARLRTSVAASVDGWGLKQVRGERGGLLFDLRAPDGDVTLRVVRHDDGQRCFTARDGLAYTHLGRVERDSAGGLQRVIDLLHGDALVAMRVQPP